ncbi:MAG: LuxR C-terminal-related transcriptional regulator [Bacteroidota bacterium]
MKRTIEGWCLPEFGKMEALFLKRYRSNRIFSKKLFISKETVDTHRKNIRDKMGVRNTAGMIREALRKGWITEIDL